jgi:hypothetical protein
MEWREAEVTSIDYLYRTILAKRDWTGMEAQGAVERCEESAECS